MYEARQTKEKVSRRIDSAGGWARQRVKLVNDVYPIQKFSVMAKSAPKINVVEEDGMGGHTIERHVGKNKEYLHTRANDVPEEVASSYTDVEVANRNTTKCIQDNWTQIKSDWAGTGLVGRRGNICYKTRISGKQYFYLAYNNKGKKKNVSNINVWLCRLLHNGRSQANMVYVNSSYPVP